MKMSTLADPSFAKSWGKIFGEDREMKPSLSYKASIVNDYLAGQNKKFNDLRQAIINKYSKKDANGNPLVKDNGIEFEVDKIQDVNKEFQELLNLDLEPAPPLRFKLQDLEENNVNLAGPDISRLKDLLDLGSAN